MTRPRLGHRDLEFLLLNSSGWRQIVTSAPERRRVARLASLGLCEPLRRKVDAVTLTELGGAIGCLCACRLGYRLKRSGVQELARNRRLIAERFDLGRGLEALHAERRDERAKLALETLERGIA